MTKESEMRGDKWHHVERRAEKFLRSMKRPPNAGIDRMKAVLENGVLTVLTMPKGQENKVKGRFIQIKASLINIHSCYSIHICHVMCVCVCIK